MKSKAQFVKDAAFSVLGRNGQYLVTLVTLPIIARHLSTGAFGLYAVGLGGYFVGSAVIDWGLSVQLAAQLPRLARRERQILRSEYFALRLILFVFLGSALAITYLASSRLVHLLLLGAVAGGLSSIDDEWVLISEGRFALVTLGQWLGRIAYLVALLVLMAERPTAGAPLIALGVGNSVACVANWCMVGRPSAWGRFHLRPLTQLLRRGSPNALSTTLSSLSRQSVSSILGFTSTPELVGAYSSSDRLVRAVQGMIDAITLAFLPRLSRIHAQRRLETADLVRLVVAALAISLPLTVGLYFAMPLLIHGLYGQAYKTAVPVAKVAVWLLPFAAVSNIVITNTALVMQKPGIALLTTSAGIATMLIGLIVLRGDTTARMAAVSVVSGEAAAALTAFALCWSAILRVGERSATQESSPEQPTTEGVAASEHSAGGARMWRWNLAG